MPRTKTSPSEKRLLEPGWAGEPDPGELDFIRDRLVKDRRLAVKWGFDPNIPTRPDWAICQVAMWGEPKHRPLNTALARKELVVGLQMPLLVDLK